jgi:hypothetical protein
MADALLNLVEQLAVLTAEDFIKRNGAPCATLRRLKWLGEDVEVTLTIAPWETQEAPRLLEGPELA